MGRHSFYNALKLLLVFNCFMYSASLHWRTNRGNCTKDEFLCDGDKCVENNKLCNSQSDCKDGLDESFCDCITNGYIPCNKGEYCVTEEDICEGVVEKCEDYKVDCPYMSTEIANGTNSVTEIPDISNSTLLPSEDCNDEILCKNGTRNICATMVDACNGSFDYCEVYCSMLMNASVENTTELFTNMGSDQDNMTNELTTVPSIDNSTYDDTTIETTTTVAEITTSDIDVIDNSSIISISSSTHQNLQTQQTTDTKLTDNTKNKTEIDISEKEITKTEVKNVTSTPVDKTKTEDPMKDTTKVELTEEATKENAKSNTTSAFDPANAASQTNVLTASLLGTAALLLWNLSFGTPVFQLLTIF